MAETLASRVGRIVSGSLHALVSAVEDLAPDTVMEQAVQEVDAAIDDVRAELGKLLAKKHLASTRLMDENRAHEDLGSRIELALRERREDLAEAAIARQLDIEAQIPLLERTIADCGDQEKELEGFIAALQARKRQMHEELAQFRRQRAASARSVEAPAHGSDLGSRAERAVSAFGRVLERNTGVPGPVTGTLGSAKQLAELEDLARQNRIRERLAAAKAKQEAT